MRLHTYCPSCNAVYFLPFEEGHRLTSFWFDYDRCYNVNCIGKKVLGEAEELYPETSPILINENIVPIYRFLLDKKFSFNVSNSIFSKFSLRILNYASNEKEICLSFIPFLENCNLLYNDSSDLKENLLKRAYSILKRLESTTHNEEQNYHYDPPFYNVKRTDYINTVLEHSFLTDLSIEPKVEMTFLEKKDNIGKLDVKVPICYTESMTAMLLANSFIKELS